MSELSKKQLKFSIITIILFSIIITGVFIWFGIVTNWKFECISTKGRENYDKSHGNESIPTQESQPHGPAACVNNPRCKAVGLLTGDCCPKSDGTGMLACCGSLPSSPAACVNNPGCKGLAGDCCPAIDGKMLRCCGSSTPSPSSLPLLDKVFDGSKLCGGSQPNYQQLIEFSIDYFTNRTKFIPTIDYDTSNVNFTSVPVYIKAIGYNSDAQKCNTGSCCLTYSGNPQKNLKNWLDECPTDIISRTKVKTSGRGNPEIMLGQCDSPLEYCQLKPDQKKIIYSKIPSDPQKQPICNVYNNIDIGETKSQSPNITNIVYGCEIGEAIDKNFDKLCRSLNWGVYPNYIEKTTASGFYGGKLFDPQSFDCSSSKPSGHGPAACRNNPRCNVKVGYCCPTNDGTMLACCGPSPSSLPPSSSPAACVNNPGCKGLAGDCCPAPDGTMLACCGPSPSSLPPSSSPAACVNNPGCKALGLPGDCCPKSDGTGMLACCGSLPSSPSPAACDNNPGCKGLAGDCCPAPDGTMLACCGSSDSNKEYYTNGLGPSSTCWGVEQPDNVTPANVPVYYNKDYSGLSTTTGPGPALPLYNAYSKWVHENSIGTYGFSLDDAEGNKQCDSWTLNIVVCPVCDPDTNDPTRCKITSSPSPPPSSSPSSSKLKLVTEKESAAKWLTKYKIKSDIIKNGRMIDNFSDFPENIKKPDNDYGEDARDKAFYFAFNIVNQSGLENSLAGKDENGQLYALPFWATIEIGSPPLVLATQKIDSGEGYQFVIDMNNNYLKETIPCTNPDPGICKFKYPISGYLPGIAQNCDEKLCASPTQPLCCTSSGSPNTHLWDWQMGGGVIKISYVDPNDTSVNQVQHQPDPLTCGPNKDWYNKKK